MRQTAYSPCAHLPYYPQPVRTPDAFPVVASLPPKSREKRRPEMRLLFAGYNTPCLLPKVLLKDVFIYLGPLKYQENLKTKVVQNLFLGGGIARC